MLRAFFIYLFIYVMSKHIFVHYESHNINLMDIYFPYFSYHGSLTPIYVRTAKFAVVKYSYIQPIVLVCNIYFILLFIIK